MTYDIFKPTDQNLDAVMQFDEEEEIRWLPRVALQYGVSGAVVRGDANVRDIVVGDRNLGRAVTVLFGPFRPHAIHFANGSLENESYDPDSDTYREIASREKVKGAGCSHGPEYLVWVPEAKTFATLHLKSYSRKLAAKVAENKGKPLVMTSEMNKKGNRFYLALKPFDGDTAALAVPTEAQATRAHELFVAPLNTSEAANER